MPVVLVHGVPDTGSVWDRLKAELPDVDTFAPTFPGYGGSPRPTDYTGARWELADWLQGELRRFGEPVDLVAHDIGSVAAHRVISDHPELIRSWVLTGVCDPEFHWHHYARIWQTSRLGEANRDLYFSLPTDARVEALVGGNLPRELAEQVVDDLDETMFDCILAYYRSSTYFGDWEMPALHERHRGMFLWGADDRFQDAGYGIRASCRLGVPLVSLPCGHWWQVERPAEAANVLLSFWETDSAEQTD